MTNKGNNHFQFIEEDILSSDSSNQFIPSSPKTPVKVESEKDQMIKKLEQKNLLLRNQIDRIDKVLVQPQQKKVKYGINIPQSSQAILNQQLQNAYKQIRSYQFEIKKLRSSQKQGSFVNQIKQIEGVLDIRQKISAKLKIQLGNIHKQSKQLTKDLKNNQKKEYYENKNIKLSSQVKFLRQKQKEIENKMNMKNSNYEKQKLFVKKLQGELLKEGFGQSALKALKNKHKTIEVERSHSRHSSSRYTTSMHKTARMSVTLDAGQKEGQIRSKQSYGFVKDQLKLLRKLQKDYLTQISATSMQKQEALKMSMISKNKLAKLDDEIDRVEQTIEIMKEMIDPKKLKPQRIQSIHNKTGGVGRYGDVNQSLSSIDQVGSKHFKHLYPIKEVGKYSRWGKKFDDRPEIGKKLARIVGIDLYQHKKGKGNIVGFLTTYQVNGEIKKSSLNMHFPPQEVQKRSINLFDSQDYFKQIQCICNQKGLIIGVIIVSLKGKTGSAGLFNGNRRPINLKKNQYPVCLYGSLNSEGLQLFGCQFCEQQKKK